jgi:hypothetical protein
MQVVTASATPHKAMLDERKKELGVEILKYSSKFMLQFAEVRRMYAWYGDCRLVASLILTFSSVVMNKENALHG